MNGMTGDMSERQPFGLYLERESGDLYAAPSLEAAKAAWQKDTGQDPEEDTRWERMPDGYEVRMADDGQPETKTAAEWAEEYRKAHGRAGGIGGQNY